MTKTGNFISYLRVPTDKQGETGYGIEGQRKAVSDYIASVGGQLVGEREFVEVETGKGVNPLDRRPRLKEALAACKKHRAKLVIAKLDRLARNVHFISDLMERKVDFVACDRPHAKPFELHIYAALAEEERRMIAERTKAGLAVVRARGITKKGTPYVPGNPQLAIRNRQIAQEYAERLADVFADLSVLSACQAAEALNAREVATPQGKTWSAQTVIRVRKRLGQSTAA